MLVDHSYRNESSHRYHTNESWTIMLVIHNGESTAKIKRLTETVAQSFQQRRPDNIPQILWIIVQAFHASPTLNQNLLNVSGGKKILS